MIKIYFLKPSNEKIKEYKLYGFDIETYGDYNKFLMGSLINEKEKYVFWNKKEMQDFILNSHKLRNSRIFATNLGFDFLGLFGDSFKLLSKFNFIIRGSDFIVIKYKNEKTKNNIQFLDTMNFLKLGVKNIGKIIGLEKMKKPDFIGEKPKNKYERDYLEKYNIQDSYISFKFADFLQKSFNKMGGNMKFTIASTSMSIYRNRYLNMYIKQPEKEIIKESFNAYYGGRTEAFYRGKLENIKLYDINSLYPHVMNNYDYPNPEYEEISDNPNIEIIKKFHGISLCNIKAPKNLMYPILPFRTNKLLFPTGNFKGYYSHIELRKALEYGYEIEPIRSIYYTKNFNPFSRFIKTMYNKRNEYKEQNNSIQISYKLILNSLYGKFAQKLKQSNIYFVFNQKQKNKIFEFLDYNTNCLENNKPLRYKIESPDNNEYYDNNGNLINEPRLFYITDLDIEKYPKFINPIISLYITSYARLELFKWFEKILNKNGKIYYCDTDSVITDIELNTSDKLGDMKLEYDIEKSIIVKPKMYFIKSKDNIEKVKTKGLMKINTYDDFKGLLDSGFYEYTKFTKFKETLRRNLSYNQKIDIKKIINFEDDKRKWKNKFNYNDFEKSEPLFI